jgi:hypothetical protein
MGLDLAELAVHTQQPKPSSANVVLADDHFMTERLYQA